MSYKKITQASYQATADKFADKVANMAPLQSIEYFARLLPSQAIILDVGCGSGRDAKVFTEKGIKVVGIDFCSNLIEIAKATAPLADFHVMDMESLTFPPRSFDGVWSASSLHHLPKKNIPAVLKQIHALLKDGGYFYLSLKKGSGEVLEEDRRYGAFEKFWAFFQEEELKKVLEEAYFKILDFAEVERQDDYQTHPFFRVFCQKALRG